MASGTRPFRKRIGEAAKNKKSSIVLALDPAPAPAAGLEKFARKTIEILQQHICAIKINFHLVLPLPALKILQINKLAHSYGLQSIADIKLNDIENTNQVAVDHLAEMGFDAVIANPFIGSNGLISLVSRSHETGLGVLALVYMSHPDASEGYGLETVDRDGRHLPVYKLFLDRALKAEADGIIVGATQAKILKDVASKKQIPIYSPGIGTQGGSIEQAVRNGTDYFIIGRSIIESKDPVRAVQEIKSRILAEKSGS